MANEPQQHIEDVNSFGTDLPKRIKAKLTARQLLAAHALEPNQSIQFPFPVRDGDDEGASTMTVKEALGGSDQNFGGDADLSSRTPVARMWTAVRLMERTDTEDGQETKSSWDPISDIKVYELGNHTLNTTSPAPTDQPIEGNSIDTQGLFPDPQHSQIIPNEFLAPPSGITNVTVRTPDPGDDYSVAIEKFTTVTFVVNNIHDFNNIYSRYFLTHRAQVIVDIAWDTALLYNPRDIINTTVIVDPKNPKKHKTVPVITQLGRGDSIYKALFGRDNGEGQKDGYVIEANGDMDTIIGTVIEFNATYRPDGSIECTVQLSSANYDLMRYSFMVSDNPNDGIGKKLSSRVDEIFQNKLEIAIEQTGYTEESTINEVNLPLGSLPDPKNTPPAFKKGILENGALRINKKVDRSSDAFTESNIYERKALIRKENIDFLSIAVIEDELFSAFGDFNSNGSFTKFNKTRYDSQFSETEPSELKLLYPQDWGILPKAKKFSSQGPPKSGDEAHTPWTKQQHIDSRQQLDLGITRLHIYSDGSGQPQNNLESDPRMIRTSQVNPKAGPMPIDIRPERNPNKSVANGGNMIGTAPTDAEYTIIGYGEVSDDPWYKIQFPWTGDSLAKAEETYLPRTVPKEIPDGGYEIVLPRISWNSMNQSRTYEEELIGMGGLRTVGTDTKPAQVRNGYFFPDTETIPGLLDPLLPGEKINENSYTTPQWADGTVFNESTQFVEGLQGSWDNTKTIDENMIDLPRLADYTDEGGPDYRLYVDDAEGIGTGNILIADSDLPGDPEIYWWRFETSQCHPGAYWGQDRRGGFPHRFKGWFYPRIFYRQIKSEVGLSIDETQEHVGEWKWSLDPRAPFPGGWVPITERVMYGNRIRVKDAGSGQMVDYDPTQQKVDGVPLTNWLGKEIVSDSAPYYNKWLRDQGGFGPPIDMGAFINESSDYIDQEIMNALGVAQLGYLRNEDRIMVDRENYYIMQALHQRTLIAKFESEEKSQTDPLLKSLSVPQPGPHQGWIHWTAGQPVDLPQEDVSMEESTDRFSYAWRKYTKDIVDDALLEEGDDGNLVKQRFRDALRGRNPNPTTVEGDKAVQQLVPIRELFINTQVLKNALIAATDVADALRRMLQDLNDAGSGAYHFRTAGNNQLATGVCIIDTEPTPVGPKNLNDLFVFSPYSQNSIIKNLNFQFQTPSDEVTEAQLGMAMAARGTSARILPVNEALDKYLTTNLLEQADLLDRTDIQWWAPEMGPSNETFSAESEFLLNPTVPTSGTDQDKKSMDVLFGKSNSMGNEVPDVMNVMVSTPDGEEISFNRAQALPNYSSAGTSDDIEFTTGESPYLPQHLKKQFELKNTKSVKDMGTKMEAFLGRSTPTPYNVTFDMYGIASEFGGRIFRMDFIPDRWFSRTYFRAFEQTQTITPETWTTSISAQMLTSNHFLQPPGKPTLGEVPTPYQDKMVLTIDPTSEEFTINPRWSELSKRLTALRIASHRGEHFSTGALLGGTLHTDLKDCTAPHLPPLTARWCSKYIGPNAPQWINDWVYGFYGAFYGLDGRLNVPKNPLKYPKGEWVAGTPEEHMENRWGREIPCTSDGRLGVAPSGGRVTGTAGSGDTRYGVGPASTVSALFDLRTNDLKGQRGLNIPKDSKVRIVRYHEYWMVYPIEFPIPGKEPQTFQLDVSKLFSIFMEMTQPDKYT